MNYDIDINHQSLDLDKPRMLGAFLRSMLSLPFFSLLAPMDVFI